MRETPAADAAVPRLELAEWAARYGLTAGITTRPANLGLATAESAGAVMSRWREFRTAFAPRFPSVVTGRQVHGGEIAWHAARSSGWVVLDGVDGHATAQPGVLLTVTVADCVPVYVAIPQRGVVALLHAGWRGTAAGILARGVERLRQAAGGRDAEIVMHCGVGICGVCYEVGPDVARQLGASLPPGTAADLLGATAPTRVDLRAVLARQAAALGLSAVTHSPWCTAHDRDRFFSHRASGGSDGRMVAYLGRPLGPG